MNREFSPIDIGLDALGLSEDQPRVGKSKLDGKSAREVVAVVGKRVQDGMRDYPEIRNEILVAGMHLMLDHVSSVDEVLSLVIPRLERSVDRMAA